MPSRLHVVTPGGRVEGREREREGFRTFVDVVEWQMHDQMLFEADVNEKINPSA
jgi:hypothetical protein